MSGFENYSETSADYDTTRVSVGLDELVDVCGQLPRSIDVLDAGCGTGNYLAALRGRLQDRLNRVVGVDLNPGMLGKAREKLGDDPHVRLLQSPIHDLPLDADQFDLVVCTQVLHHLDPGDSSDDSGTDRPNVRAFLAEARRVQRPDGILAINSTSHAQLRDGFWWAQLIPGAVESLVPRLPDVPWLMTAMEDAGFTNVRKVVPKGVLQGDAYFDLAGPLNPAWRLGDSTWTLASAEELATALARVRGLLDSGEMAGWFAEREARRALLGQSTFVLGS